MSAYTSLVSLHLSGEDQTARPDALTLDTWPGQFTLTCTDAALTASGGLVAWSGFLKHLGIIERFAERWPVTRTSPNAAPGREVRHSFTRSALVEGKRFCHVRWLTDDPAIATIMNPERVGRPRGTRRSQRKMGWPATIPLAPGARAGGQQESTLLAQRLAFPPVDSSPAPPAASARMPMPRENVCFATATPEFES